MSNRDGLSSANFVSGAMQGYQFMEGVENNQLRRDEIKQNRGLRDAEESRRKESHSAQMQAHEQNQKIQGIKLDQIDEATSQKMNQALAWSLHNAKDMPPEYQQLVAAHPNLNAQRIMSDEAGKYLEVLEGAATGKVDYRSPEVAEAFDFLNPEIGLGATGGRKVKTSRLVPGKTPGTVMVGLSVEGDDRVRPLTERRSSDDDDPVKEVPLEVLIQRAQTMKQYRNMLLDPKGRDWFIKTNLPATAASKDGKWSDIKTDSKTGITFQTNLSTGEIKQLDNRKTGGAGGKSGSGSASALEKEVEYLKSIGLPQDTALDIATNSKQNPAAHIISIAKAISETDGVSIKEAIDQAKSVYEEKLGRKLTKPDINKIESAQLATQVMQSTQPQQSNAVPVPMRRPAPQAPAAALEFLKANPNQAEAFKAKYGYLPE